MSEIKTKKELMERLRGMGDLSREQKAEVVCALIGHSRIQTHCLGYYNCARCDQQTGDALGGAYPGAEKAVVVGHNCEVCRDNYKECTWRDKYLAPNPFKDSP